MSPSATLFSNQTFLLGTSKKKSILFIVNQQKFIFFLSRVLFRWRNGTWVVIMGCVEGVQGFSFQLALEMKQKGTSDLVGKVVVVAVKAAREIPRTALVWALTHIVQPGDCIKLLVVIPAHSSSNLLFLRNTFSFTFICFLLTFYMVIEFIELIWRIRGVTQQNYRHRS